MKKSNPHFSRSRLSQAIALALMTAAATPAMAGSGSCSDGSNTISGAVTDTCWLEPGDSLNVTGTGSITDSSDSGVYVYGGSNSITNAGTITGYNAGLYIYGGGAVQGSVINTGTIESTDYHAVYVYGAGSNLNITGNFINSGNITASDGSGIYVYDSSLNIAGDFINSGTIEADDYGIYVYAAAGARMNIAGDLVNSGTILSGETALYIYGAIGGDITNSGTIISTNDTGIYIMNTGAAAKSITNSGTIIADDRGLAYSGNVTGDVTNSGLIQSGSGDAGMYIFSGGLVGGNIVNSGTIDSGGYGIYLYTDVAGNIENTGLIEADSAGIHIFYSSAVGGSIINSGTINSGDYGIYIYADVGGNVVNSGLIDSDGSGMYIYGSNIAGSLINSGIIESDGKAGLYLYGSSFGGIENSGTIDVSNGGEYGIYLYGSSVSGDIVNSGTIDASGDTYPSIYVYNSSVAGEVINSGTLLGHIYVDDGNVTNSGLIHTLDEQSEVNDDYDQSAGGEFRFNADSTGSFGYLDVDDTATFADETILSVDAQVGHTLADGDVLNDVVTAGTLDATSFTVNDNVLALQFTAAIDGDTVDLTAAATGLTTVEAAGVGGEAGVVIDTIMAADPSGELAFAIGSSSTVGELEQAVEGTMPALGGGVSQASLDFLTSFDGLVGDRQAGIASGDQTLINRNFWFKGYASAADQGKRDGVSGYDVDSLGMAFGVDGEISSTWTVGAAGSYTKSDVESKVAIGSHDIDAKTWFAKVYATNRLDADTAVNLQAGIGFSDFGSKRVVAGGAVASADYDAKHFRASAELVRGYQISNQSNVAPYVRADYRYVDVDGYTETGAGGLNLTVDDDSADSLILGVGVRGSYTASNDWVLTGDVGIGYDAMTDESSLTASFQGSGAQFSVDGMEASKVVYNLGLGAKYQLDNGTEIRAGYDLNGRKDYTDQSLSVKARWKF